MFSQNLLSLLNNISCLYYLAESFITLIRFSRDNVVYFLSQERGGGYFKNLPGHETRPASCNVRPRGSKPGGTSTGISSRRYPDQEANLPQVDKITTEA